ncbi:sigma-70 family RNA polymerase sigma factor [Flavobacteriaceae bacterium XHP0103]|uniref:sigma-70 family RNA polymerase sigma factor n=1 Tax=Marixanthotalea marina TaxID=2844359 RepID=UPI002989E197|nr:sigma-70 family RNA polymerase sigma factor [Marixanthotalea marina]MBU3823171.1 sigma-70 family RNA polymerase sigma factor [Marixanthotalea marina]
MSDNFYKMSILPFATIIIKICKAYTNTEEDFEDYYQEVCLQIWKSRNNFSEEAKWSTWVYKVSLNTCLTLLKKKKNNDYIFASDFNSFNINEKNQAFSDEALNELYSAIKLLSEVDRAVILLYLEEKPYKEIAEIIGTSPSNISTRVNRIKKRLKIILNGKIN